MPHKRVSINCDIGEGYFRWNLGPDEALMQLVDYANIACGFHAGDYNTMVRTVRAAIKYGVKMGAHPGLDDVKGFGRRKIDVSPDDIYASTLYQLGALKAIIEAEGGTFSHVKPHGMLFFILRDSEAHMRAFMRAQTAIFSTSIPFFGFADCNHSKICAEFGVRHVPEVYLDIDYDKDGVLLGVPGSRPASVELVKRKAEMLMTEGKTFDLDDNPLALKPAQGNFSICMHSDLPGALDMVKSLREIVDKYNT